MWADDVDKAETVEEASKVVGVSCGLLPRKNLKGRSHLKGSAAP